MGAFDLSGFLRATQGFDDQRLADVVDQVYQLIAAAVEASGGRVVKYLGDGGLAVWPTEQADAAIEAVLRLRSMVGPELERLGVRSELVCRVHAADVVAGEFGPNRSFDVIGSGVFTLFRLPARTVAVSAEAFRKLSPEMRSRLKKHTEPVVYIPVADPRP
ncbi:MAG TPA: adenylate/guanylate cyclase domain-containing protein [Acidimicrobiia bacterium]|nr:adenylate/guanylate cyclase domain-containing protein [Acidimicrobiia bacterium]